MSRLEQEFEQQKLNQQEFGLRIDPPTGGLSKQGLGIEGVRSSTSYRPTGVAARRRPLFARTDLEREGYNTALPWLALSLIHHIPFPLTTFYEHTPTFVVHFTFAFTMRTSTSFAALVALMAVAGSAAPIGARTFPAPAPVPDNHSTPSKDSGSIITIPNPLCGNCHDDTVKNVPDHSKSAEDTIKAVVDIGKNGGHVIDVVPSVHADVDIGDKEHHEQPPKNESKPPMNNQKPPQNDQKPPHDDSDIKVDVKADVKDEIKADVHANVKDVVEANVSVNDPKGGKHDEVKDMTKNVKDGAKGPAPDAHDIVAEVKADLGKVVGDGGIVSLGQKPKQDADCDDLLKVGGKPVVSSSLLRRFSSRILPQGWVV